MTTHSDAAGDVMVGCLHCTTGAVYEMHVGPGEGWFYVAETGWACPAHALMAATTELEAANEHVEALKAKLATANTARETAEKALPDLRDALRRVLIIHDDLLTDGLAMADKMAFEARLALKKAGVRV